MKKNWPKRRPKAWKPGWQHNQPKYQPLEKFLRRAQERIERAERRR